MLRLIQLFTFISAIMLFHPIVKFIIGKQKSIYRIKRYTSLQEERGGNRSSAKNELRAGLNVLSRGIGGFRLLDGYKKRTQQKLNRAHILLKAEEFLTLCIIIFTAAALLFYLLSRSIAPALLAGLAGWLVPQLVVKSKTKARIKTLNEQLGDAIILISNSLKAGYSFFQATDIVTREMSGPIAEEFSMMQKEINLGLTTEAALENLAGRVASDDLELLVTAVLIQRQAGGNLAEVLDNISSTIRDRIKIKGEVRTVTAQGRMSGLIISILPVLLGILIYLINPEHISVLFKTQIGLIIVIFSACMELIGIYFINKIVKIEV